MVAYFGMKSGLAHIRPTQVAIWALYMVCRYPSRLAGNA